MKMARTKEGNKEAIFLTASLHKEVKQNLIFKPFSVVFTSGLKPHVRAYQKSEKVLKSK